MYFIHIRYIARYTNSICLYCNTNIRSNVFLEIKILDCTPDLKEIDVHYLPLFVKYVAEL